MPKSFVRILVAVSSLIPLAAQGQTLAGGEQPPAAAAPPAAPAAQVAALPPDKPGEVAQETPPPATPATPPPVAFQWEALVDTYYMWNFTGDPSTQGPAFRQFDQTANSFSLNYAKLGVQADTQYVAFRMDVGAGHTAAILNSTIAGMSAAQGANGTVTSLSGLNAGDFLVQQAYGTVKPTSWLSIDAGRFVTSAGAEVIEANKNWLYSRSFLFFGEPLLHTGLRVNVVASPSLKLQASLVNGWNNDVDNNVGKTGGFSATFSPPNSGTTAAFNTYFGKESAGSGGPTRLFLDGVFTQDIGNLSVGANVDYFKNGDPWWIGFAAMGRFIFNDLVNVAGRFELISSKKDAFTGLGGANPAFASLDALLYEGTVMVGFSVAKHYELRIEGRGDFSDKDIFTKGSSQFNRKNQFTGTAAFLTYF